MHLQRKTHQTRRGSIVVDGRGYLTFEDRGVPPGRHGYRLTIESAGQGAIEQESWLEVPALAVELRAPAPNPSGTGRLTVSFVLPSAAPATIDLLDVAGRCVTSRSVGGMGPGSHELRLAEAEPLPGGIYIVRLRQNGREISRKAVVVR